MKSVLRAAAYTRVSTEEQAKEGYSIGAQHDRLTQFANSQGWSIVEFYTDEGVSAKDTNRPELQRMLKDIVDKKIDVVIVLRLDRLTRSVLDLYKLLEHFEKCGTGFKSATEVYDTTTAIGRLFLTLVAALAQWERENLGERVRFAMDRKVNEGLFHGGRTPYGYIPNGKELVTVEEEAKVVKLIFEKYLQGLGVQRITKWLNHNGYKTRKGHVWNMRGVKYILDNPAYVGILRWNFSTDDEYMEYESEVPPLVSKEDFDRVQIIRKEQTLLHPRSIWSDYIFSAHIRCSRCGSAMAGSSTKSTAGVRYKYYLCQGRLKGICDMPQVGESSLEENFVKYITSNVAFDDAAKIVAEGLNGFEDRGNLEKELRRIDNELSKIKERRKAWQYAFAEKVITLDDLRARSAEDDEQESTLKGEFEKIKSKLDLPRISHEEWSAFLMDFSERWKASSTEQKKVSFPILVKEIVVDVDDTIPTRTRRRNAIITEIVFN